MYLSPTHPPTNPPNFGTDLLHRVEISVPYSPRRPLSFLLSLPLPGSRCCLFFSSFPLLCLGARERYRDFLYFLLYLLLRSKKGRRASPLSASPPLCRWEVSTRLLAGMEKRRATSPRQTEQKTATRLRRTPIAVAHLCLGRAFSPYVIKKRKKQPI